MTPADVYTFNNCWAYNVDKLIPTIFENTFYSSTCTSDGTRRIKSIINPYCCDIMGIHHVLKYSNANIKNINNPNMVMYHFLMWSLKRKFNSELDAIKNEKYELITIEI